jgi:hypothetical protein
VSRPHERGRTSDLMGGSGQGERRGRRGFIGRFAAVGAPIQPGLNHESMTALSGRSHRRRRLINRRRLTAIGLILATIGGLDQIVRALASRNHRFDVAGNPDGQIFILIIGVLLVSVSLHGMARVGSAYTRIWQSRLFGFIVHGQVTAQMPEVDDDGDVHWTVRVGGTAPDGTAFDEVVPAGWGTPPALTSAVRVRCHPPTRSLKLVRRGPHAIATGLIGDALFIVVLAIGASLTIGGGFLIASAIRHLVS